MSSSTTTVEQLGESLDKLLEKTKSSISSIHAMEEFHYKDDQNNENRNNEKGRRIVDLVDEDKSKIAKLIQQLLKVNDENATLRSQLDQQTNAQTKRITDLEEKINELTIQNNTIFEEKELLNQSAIELKKKFSHSLELLKTYQDRISDMNTNLEDLEQQLKDKESGIVKTLQDQVAVLQETIFEQQRELGERKTVLSVKDEMVQADLEPQMVPGAAHEVKLESDLHHIREKIDSEKTILEDALATSALSKTRYRALVEEYNDTLEKLHRNIGIHGDHTDRRLDTNQAFLNHSRHATPVKGGGGGGLPILVDKQAILGTLSTSMEASDLRAKLQAEDSLLEEFLQVQRAARQNQGTSQYHRDPPTSRNMEHGSNATEREFVESSYFDASFFDIVDELEAR